MNAPVDEARDEYADAMNLELRQSIAARVLEAMDVDQYLIDAVRSAKPPEPQAKPAIEEPEGFGSVVRAAAPDWTTRPLLWQKTPAAGKHYWESETGVIEVWSSLSDVEVLRVGIGPEIDPHMATMLNAFQKPASES